MKTYSVLQPALLLFSAVGLACGIRTAPAAEAAAGAKINYTDHIRPIFREHCFGCHNQGKAKNDLALDSYEAVMKGGASGEAVKPGSPDDSYLWQLVSHQSEPSMPPMQDKLPEAKLALIKRWIVGGALKDAGSKAVLPTQPTVNLSAFVGATRPAGPPLLPKDVAKTPVTHVSRPGPVVAVAASPWAPLWAVAGQKQVLLYHSDSGTLLGILPFPEGVAYALRFSRSGAVLLAAGGHAVREGKAVGFEVISGKRLFTVGDEPDAILAADLDSSHAHVALGGSDRLVKVFAVADGSPVHRIKKHTDWIYAIEYSPDGKLLASADRSGGLWLWEAESGQEHQNLEGHQGAVNDVSWRDDSQVLASAGDDGTIRLWDATEGKLLKRFTAHNGGVMAVKFAHDGRLVSAGRDKLVKVWSPDGQQQKAYTLPDQALRAAVGHDASRVAGGDWSGEIRVWTLVDDKETVRLKMNP